MTDQPCGPHDQTTALFCLKDKIWICRKCAVIHVEKHHIFKLPNTLVQNYSICNYLGHGASGVVFKVQSNSTGETLAAKIIQAQAGVNPAEDTNVKEAKNESQILGETNHPYLIRSQGVETELDENLVYYVILMEFCEFSLKNYLSQPKIIPKVNLNDWIMQIAQGVHYLHCKGLIHRDLKPDNIFLKKNEDDDYYSIKIGDFGISKIVNPEKTTKLKHGDAGTMKYMSPEALNNMEYGRNTDIWACGIIFFEILHGQHPYQKGPEEKKLKKLGELIVTRMQNREEAPGLKEKNLGIFKELLEKCLAVDNRKRFDSNKMLAELIKVCPVSKIDDATPKPNHDKKPPIEEPDIVVNIEPETKKLLLKSTLEQNDIDLKNTIDLSVIQDDFEQTKPSFHQLKPKEAENLRKIINTVMNYKSLKVLKLEICQHTYDRQFIKGIASQVSTLTGLEQISLKINNHIVLVETSPGDCLVYWLMVLLSFGIYGFIGKKSSCSRFYCDFAVGRRFKLNAYQFVNDDLFKEFCSALCEMKRLKEATLDFSSNNITASGIMRGLSMITKSGMGNTKFKFTLTPQMNELNYREVEDIKQFTLAKNRNITTDL